MVVLFAITILGTLWTTDFFEQPQPAAKNASPINDEQEKVKSAVSPHRLDKTGKKKEPPTSDVARTAPAPKQRPNNQEIATKKLKHALDSWVLGDLSNDFDKKDPDLLFVDVDWVFRKVLMRYDVGPIRDNNGEFYEIAVLAVFQSRAGTEIKNRKKYKATPPNTKSKKWVIVDMTE